MQIYTLDGVVMRYYYFINEHGAILSHRSREKKLTLTTAFVCRHVARELS